MKTYFSIVVLFFSLSLLAQNNTSAFKKVETTKIPKPTAPAKLVIYNLKFNDSKGNNNLALDAGESADILLTIKNEGNGNAYETEISLNEKNNVKNITISSLKIDLLKPGEIKDVIIPISADLLVENNDLNIDIQAIEGNGFDSDPSTLNLKTFKFRTPELVIADYKFSTKEGDSKIKLGETVNLQFIIHNKGQGVANNVKVFVTNPINVFPVNDTFFEINQLAPNKTYTVSYDFIANKRYKESQINLLTKITESSGKYGDTKSLSVSLDQVLSKTQTISIEALQEKEVTIDNISLTSEVDKNIPINPNQNINKIALIIGNEDYSSRQSGMGSEINVAFAANDARVMKEYFIKTFGIAENNVYYITNATAGEMKKKINLVTELIKKMEGVADFYFYYAGHGFPDEVTKTPYLIPVDVTASNLTDGINLYDMYRRFSDANPKRATIFLDACFSGGGRDAGLLAARAVKIKPKQESITGNLIVLSATSEEQSALPFKEKQHGMFTYQLLKKIQETNGNVDYKTLFNSVAKNVSIESLKVNEKSQDPQILYGIGIANYWENWKINE